MADNKILVKRTSTSGRTPNTSDPANTQYISAGELALNMADGLLFTSNGSALIEVGANNTTQTVTTNNLTVGNTLYVVANGNVGIGNNTPSRKLSVEGSLGIGNTQLISPFGTSALVFGVLNNSTCYIYGAAGTGNGRQIRLNNESSIGWSPTTPDGNPDVVLIRNGSQTAALRNGANSQTLQVHGTYTDASNYERLSFTANATGNWIRAEAAGTGTPRQVNIYTDANTTQNVFSVGSTVNGTAVATSTSDIFRIFRSSNTDNSFEFLPNRTDRGLRIRVDSNNPSINSIIATEVSINGHRLRNTGELITTQAGSYRIGPDVNQTNLANIVFGGTNSAPSHLQQLGTVSIRGYIANNNALGANSTGGFVYIVGGNGASNSSNQSNGGSVYIDGGSGFGTGTSGHILLGTVLGNVGIGNTTPAHKLRVEGDISLSGGIHANGGFGTSGQILTSNGTVAYWSTSTSTKSTVSNTAPISPTTGDLWWDTDVGTLFVYDSSAWAEATPQVLQEGPIGTYTLDGTFVVENDLTVKGTLFETSDIKLKENIETFNNPLETTKLLRGVTFDWKENKKKSAGVIAQELEQVLPYLVNTDNEGLKSVNYVAIIGVLIEAIKELSDKIEEKQ